MKSFMAAKTATGKQNMIHELGKVVKVESGSCLDIFIVLLQPA